MECGPLACFTRPCPFSGLPTKFSTVNMPRTKGSREIDAATKGAIIIATDIYDKPHTEVARDLNVSNSSIQAVRKRVHDDANKENVPPIQAANNRHSRSGRPVKIDVRDRRRLVRHATKNKANRRKPWSQIAQECGIDASYTAIAHAFEIAGYIRRPPRYKPALSLEQKQKRLEFCVAMLEKDPDWWRMIVWTDETPIKVGAHRGQVWVTRKKNEAYHPDCVNPRFTKYSDLMFWGAFSAECRGPYHIWARETTDEKNAAQEDLKEMNVDYDIEAQILREQHHAEQQLKPKSRRRKTVPKPEGKRKQRRKGLKGGVDWYRYRTDVLLPKLLPFCREIIGKYGACYLLEDGASPHIAWENVKEYDIEDLHRIPWPANSPDLNMIEQAWYHLKRRVTQLPFIVSTIPSTKDAYQQAWQNLEQERIQKWVDRMIPNMRKVREQGGDNKFHG